MWIFILLLSSLYFDVDNKKILFKSLSINCRVPIMSRETEVHIYTSAVLSKNPAPTVRVVQLSVYNCFCACMRHMKSSLIKGTISDYFWSTLMKESAWLFDNKSSNNPCGLLSQCCTRNDIQQCTKHNAPTTGDMKLECFRVFSVCMEIEKMDSLKRCYTVQYSRCV